MGIGNGLKRLWHFIWYDDSLASWLVNLVLAFVLVKFILYPGIGLTLGTEFPIVAVVSNSMEHDGKDFDSWWDSKGGWYEDKGITKNDFEKYKFVNGFNKGDIMVLKGVEPKDINTGDVLVYEIAKNRNPIIHRVVDIDDDGSYTFVTKGDRNSKQDKPVGEEQIERTGRAVFRLPFLGWVKIWFVSIFN